MVRAWMVPALLMVLIEPEASMIAIASWTNGVLAVAMSEVGATVPVEICAVIEACSRTSISGTLARSKRPSAVALPPPRPLTEAVMLPGVLVTEEVSSPDSTMRGMLV